MVGAARWATQGLTPREAGSAGVVRDVGTHAGGGAVARYASPLIAQ